MQGEHPPRGGAAGRAALQQQQMQGQLQRMLVEQQHQQMRLRRYAATGRAEQTPTLRDRQQAWEEQADLMQEAREEAARPPAGGMGGPRSHGTANTDKTAVLLEATAGGEGREG